MKVGLITYHRAYNCGAMLQAWALKTVIERFGHVVEFPTYYPICIHGRRSRFRLGHFGLQGHPFKWLVYQFLYNLMSLGTEDLARYRYNSFRRRNFFERTCSQGSVAKIYDLLVFGSDMVWARSPEMVYFLGETTMDAKRRISYAASCGDKLPDDDILRRLHTVLQTFSHISVRERFLAEYLNSSGLDKTVYTALDPTLLLTSQDYDKIKVKRLVKEKYLLYFTAQPGDFGFDIAKNIGKRLGLKLICCTTYHFSRFDSPSGITYGCSPDRLLSYIANAEYVISNSFHGTMFSIIYRKRFVNMENKKAGEETRAFAMLKKLGASERHKTVDDTEESIIGALVMPPSATMLDKLELERKASLSWLTNALQSKAEWRE